MSERAPTPVVIVDYDPRWPALYEAERAKLVAVFGGALVEIEHIGSTSVPGLASKPTVDIIAGLRDEAAVGHFLEPMASLGYHYEDLTASIPQWHLFSRRDEVSGYHVHVVPLGGEFWRRHLAFRDYLRAHPATARQYEWLKRDLAALFGSDRMGYCNAKTNFISSVEHLALA